MIDVVDGHLAIVVSEPAVLLQIGPVAIRWYALAYIGGMLAGWALLRRMLAAPAAPMTNAQLADFFVWAILGIIVGGRLGYVLFYDPASYLADPLSIFATWRGGMSFHGGGLGLLVATLFFAKSHSLSGLRIFDYVVVVQPIGQGLGRLANFFNGELWGAPTSLPWGIIFEPGGPPRHPSQLYEFALEGAALFVLLSGLFWRTSSRLRPGLLTGVYCLGFAGSRILVELVREPDEHLRGLTGPLQMGQWLSLPMILVGLLLVSRAYTRPLCTSRQTA
jgi:phosphatidylglycerol---prolipoprotein diacylglyceryl transferase